jgi:hypothetical protein
MRFSLGPLVGIAAISALACGSDGDSSTTGPATPVLSTTTISGNTELTAVGQTTQLSLTAGYNDGTSRDRTGESGWITRNPTVATVARGLVTAVGLGSATIEASYSTRAVVTVVNVAPAGMFLVEGRVREPGAGSLAGVRVVEQVSFTDTRTNGAGVFQFAAPTVARIRIEHPDYEVFESEVTKPEPPYRTTFLDAPLQRTVRLNSGLSRSDLQIAPNDVAYTIGGDVCNPCKLIRVNSSSPTVTLRLAWTGASAGALKLWANGTRNSTAGSSITVTAPTAGSQSLVYVGWYPAAQPNTQFQYAFFSLSVD